MLFLAINRIKNHLIVKYILLAIGIVVTLIIMILYPRFIFFLVGTIIYYYESKLYKLMNIKFVYGIS